MIFFFVGMLVRYLYPTSEAFCVQSDSIVKTVKSLKNKRIRSVADLLQDKFGLDLVRLENMVR